MHDLSLGGPVAVERYPDAKHNGSCFDGVFGCHRCWNADNDGNGTVFECEWCKAKDVLTLITRADDEPVLYAVCHGCIEKRNERLARELAEYDNDFYDYRDDDDDR